MIGYRLFAEVVFDELLGEGLRYLSPFDETVAFAFASHLTAKNPVLAADHQRSRT